MHFQIRIGVFNCQQILISFVLSYAEMLQQFQEPTPKAPATNVTSCEFL